MGHGRDNYIFGDVPNYQLDPVISRVMQKQNEPSKESLKDLTLN